jgi:iron complex outermembrane receptor protein
MLRNTYFGQVTRNGFPFGGEQVHSAKIVTDMTASYKLSKHLAATIGANNLFDIFPDKQIYENSYFGVFKYAPVQMGTTGRYVFARLNFTL